MPSAQSSGPTDGSRSAPIVCALAAALVAACSLLAPNEEQVFGASSGSSGQAAADGRSGGSGGSGGNHAGGDSAIRGGSSGGDTAFMCSADLADCNDNAADGCEVDLSSSHANCGGCGQAFACAEDEACEGGACVSLSGCSDRTREGFLPASQWPRLAGCTAKWPMSSLRTAKTGAACGFELAVCQVPADACGKGWHVCAMPPFGPAEVSEQATAEECAAQPGAFVAAVGDQMCDPCSEQGSGAACCGQRCVQQNGSCIYPGLTAWFGVHNNHINRCGDIESDLVQRGVLCCKPRR